MVKSLFAVAVTAVLAAAGTSALAQTYPSQPIKFLVPYTPGTGMDTIARVSRVNTRC